MASTQNLLLVAEDLRDLDGLGGPYAMASARDYLDRPEMFSRHGLRVINLSRGYNYQSLGYYVSLLAEARGQRVLPAVETAIDLSTRSGYERALPELESALRRDIAERLSADQAQAQAQTPWRIPAQLTLSLGVPDDAAFQSFSRLLFDWFRCPILMVRLSWKKKSLPDTAEWLETDAESLQLELIGIGRIQAGRLSRGNGALRERFAAALAQRSQHTWRERKSKNNPLYSLAVLYDPDEALPPTSVQSLKYLARLAEKQLVEVEPIRKRDLARLAEYDALFIRETTSIHNHTYRFAQRARAEGMPVIDDVDSMIRCTNKVYLWERLNQAGVPTPRTIVLQSTTALAPVAEQLGLPLVLKLPDGAFSRGVKKANTVAELETLAAVFFRHSQLLLAQQFVPTRYDWRIGVLGGEALFACHYTMARNHWQIVNHRPDGKAVEGGFRTFALDRVDPVIIDTALAASRLIGNGLYGVDLKESAHGLQVIEINDNPNLEHRVEDAAAGTLVWERLLQWFIDRLKR